MSRLVSIWREIAQGHGADPEIALKLEGFLQTLGMFSEFNVKQFAIPLCGTSEGDFPCFLPVRRFALIGSTFRRLGKQDRGRVQ